MTKREILFNAMRDGKPIKVTNNGCVCIGFVDTIRASYFPNSDGRDGKIRDIVVVVEERRYRRLHSFWLSLVEIAEIQE
jgi:hypothetical protein